MERTWLRWQLRRHWRSLTVLMLLVAVASGFVTAATAGALRGMSAQDRTLAVTRPATVQVLPNQVGFDWDAVRRLPMVTEVSEFAISGFFIDDGTGVEHDMENPSGWFPPVGLNAYEDVEKPAVLEGRMLDPTRPDEVVVSPEYLTIHHKKIGDSVTLRLFAPATLSSYWYAPSDMSEPDGPVVEATIVGSIVSAWYSEPTGAAPGFVLVSPEIAERYPGSIFGEPPVAYVNALVRLAGGEADIPAFTAALGQLTGRTDIEIWNAADAARQVQRSLDFQSWSLIALAVAAAIAASFLLGQAFARSAAAASAQLAPLRDTGLTRRRSVVAATLPLVVATFGGVALGVVLAILASPLFPLGTARKIESTPGFDVDWPVLLGMAVPPVAFLIGTAAFSAWLGTRSLRAAPRVSALATWAARVGLPVPVVMGTRFALEPGRGAHTTPVRPALLGAIAGVAGIVAVLTFSSGLVDVQNNPARYGTVYDLMIYAGSENTPFANVDAIAAALGTDAEVAGVNFGRFAVAETGSTKVTLSTIDTVAGDPLPFTVASGRLPESASEIALGPTMAAELGVHVGDTLVLQGSQDSLRAKLVGLAFTPVSSHSNYDDAGLITPAGYQVLWGDNFKQSFMQVAFAPGSDAAAVTAHVNEIAAEANGGTPVAAMPVSPPAQVFNLDHVAKLPQVLGIFLAVLAVGSLGHALVTAIRRRRHAIAVLRALGQSPGQARIISLTQATVVAVVGLLFGVPLGIAIGRTLWRFVADITPVAFADPVTVVMIVLAIPTTLLVTNLLAVWPSRQAARLSVAATLRTE